MWRRELQRIPARRRLTVAALTVHAAFRRAGAAAGERRR
jgi:hypothetical protein